MNEKTNIQVALVGNPNSGKTSIFNALTGAHQHVGNYAGVTVEKREGLYNADNNKFKVLDLPGTYSLTSYSPEERITQNELLEKKQDIVVVVVDSNALKRSLVLLAQIMQIAANPVLCLNMSDEAEKAGQKIDTKKLTSLIGCPVVQTVAHKGIGIHQLKVAISKASDKPMTQNRLVLGDQLDLAIHAIKKKLEPISSKNTNLDWVAIKLLIGEEPFIKNTRSTGKNGENAIAEAIAQKKNIESETGLDISIFVMERYYGFVDGLLQESIKSPSREDARYVSDQIDSIVVNRALGIPIFLFVMYAIFWITFTIGQYPMDWIDFGFSALGDLVSGFWPQDSVSQLRSLIVDGVIAGVGGVVIFLPNIILLFLGLAFLEDTGYMARAAFVMDRLMHLFGLHGKSFIPMMSGFGCSIPGIMATRTLECEKDRLTTMFVLPLMSCGARLPIWMLLIPAFFPETWRAPMLWIIYMIGIILAMILALLLRKTVLKGEEAPFVMELPPYRMPTVRAVIRKMTERSWLYIRKAGTIILGISILMWFFTAYPKLSDYKIDEKINNGSIRIVEVDRSNNREKDEKLMTIAKNQLSSEAEMITLDEFQNRRANEKLKYSVMGRIGQFIEPFVRPLGFDWKISTAILGAFVAKEVFVSQMGIVYSLGETDENSTSLQETLRRNYSPLIGFSLMLFLLISAPCMATIAATFRESGSWKWAFFQLVGLTVIAYITSFLVYQIGRLFIG